MKAERHQIAGGTDRRSCISGAESVCRIFNDRYSRTDGHVLQFSHLAGMAREVHGNDRFRFRVDCFGDKTHIKVQRVGLYIDKNGNGADMLNDIRRRDKSQSTRDHFVARLYIQYLQGKMESSSA